MKVGASPGEIPHKSALPTPTLPTTGSQPHANRLCCLHPSQQNTDFGPPCPRHLPHPTRLTDCSSMPSAGLNPVVRLQCLQRRAPAITPASSLGFEDISPPGSSRELFLYLSPSIAPNLVPASSPRPSPPWDLIPSGASVSPSKCRRSGLDLPPGPSAAASWACLGRPQGLRAFLSGVSA